MQIATLPLNEDLRLQDLYAHDILDTDAEKDFDDLLELVAALTGCSMAAISFMDKHRQWFKAVKGLDVSETPRDLAFCSHTILQNAVLVVEDAKKDERFVDNPLVKQTPHIRFYAGAPLVSLKGFSLGTVCVLDKQPRSLKPEQERVLQIVSAQISRLLELRLKNNVLKSRASDLLQTEKFLLQQTLHKHEAERFGIGKELHENIAQSLAATKIYLEMAAMGGPKSAELVARSLDCVAQLLEQVRNLSKAIMPSTLAEVDLEEMLNALRSRFCRQTGLDFRLSFSCSALLSSELSLALYRIAEEQLENIRRHARATEVWMDVQGTKSVRLSIRDNGIGINTALLKKGTGLNKILAWTEERKGEAVLTGRPLQGCTLTVSLPLLQKKVVETELSE